MLGKWRAPLVSARIAANIRKQALLDGTFGSFSVPQGEKMRKKEDKKRRRSKY
jgi:hypothetical protein